MFHIERTNQGKPQFIVNQDRDRIYPMYLQNLHSVLNEKDGNFFGINLIMEIPGEYVLLGTFDTVKEVMDEIEELYNTNLEIYCISGYDENCLNQTPQETFQEIFFETV